jgi:hypothetical protein
MTTEIEQDKYFEPVEDIRYSLSSQKIPVDNSNSIMMINHVNAYESSSNGTCYNAANKICKFKISIPSDSVLDVASCALKISGHAYYLNTGAQTYVANTVSIPWDTAGALIQDIYVKCNSQSEYPISYMGDTYRAAHAIRMACEKSSTWMQNNGDILMLPSDYNCSARDTTTALNDMSLLRRNLNLVSGSAIQYHTKILPFPYLLEFFNTSQFMKLNELELHILFRDHTNILYKLAANVNQQYYDIDSVELIVGQVKMSSPQQLIEAKNNSPQHMAYSYYELLKTNMTPNTRLSYDNQTNLQGAILAFPATNINTNINPIQFIETYQTGIQWSYDNRILTDTTTNFDNTNHSKNTEAYYWYKKLCKKELTSNFVPGLSASEFLNTSENFFIMCSPMFESDVITLNSGSGRGLLTITTYSADTGNTVSLVYVVKIREKFVQFNMDGSFTVIQQ